MSQTTTNQPKPLFSQALSALEQAIYAVGTPDVLLNLPTLAQQFAEHGWRQQSQTLADVLADAKLMAQDDELAANVGWQVERQLQDLYSYLLQATDTLTSTVARGDEPSLLAAQEQLAANQSLLQHAADPAPVLAELNFSALIRLFESLQLTHAAEVAELLQTLTQSTSLADVTQQAAICQQAITAMVGFDQMLRDLANQTVNEAKLTDIEQILQGKADALAHADTANEPTSTTDIYASVNHLDLVETVDDHADGMTADQPTIEQPTAQAAAAESDALIAARASLKPDDDSSDDDIREIFIEEAEEVLDEMDANLAVWQTDPTDLAVLKEIRRGFHTLKGSGRMVGALMLGETAWAVENMLNRVLDGTLPVSDDLVAFIRDTRAKIPTLVQDFSQKQPPSIDPAVVVLQATNLLHGQPIDTGLTATSVSQPVHAVEQADLHTTADSKTPMTPKADKAYDDTSIAPTENATLPADWQVLVDAIEPVADAPADEDIQEIYIEEAHEVLDTIRPLFDDWQHTTDDLDTLKEIRRGFHTLKGSGRMVGANQLGELAWSIENMLNRVLDHTVAVSSGMVRLLADVLGSFDGLVDRFAEQSGYPDDVFLWQAAAQVYAKPDAALDYALLTGASADTTAAPVTADMVAENLAADGADDLDTIADDIFIEEAQELLEKIDDFIQLARAAAAAPLVDTSDDEAQPAEILVTDGLVRAFHTLRGGAALSNMPTVYAISAALETALGDLMACEQGLTASQISLITQARDEIWQAISEYHAQPTTKHSIEDTDLSTITQDWVKRFDAAQMVEGLRVHDLLALDIDALLDVNVSALASLAQKAQVQQNDSQPADSSAPVTDDEPVSSDTPALDWSVQIAHLVQQAERLNERCTGYKYARLTTALAQVYQALQQNPEFLQDLALANALAKLQEQLIGMCDAIAAGLNVKIDEANVQALINRLEMLDDAAQLADLVYEPIDTDIDLVDVFVEEAQNLREAIQASFGQWQNALESTTIVAELRRYFHTLKGGANMIGLLSIAELARYAEMLYHALAIKQLEPSPEMVEVMQQVHETFDAQMYQLTQHQRAFFATRFIGQLADLVSGRQSVYGLRLRVPPLVKQMRQAAQATEAPALETPDLPTITEYTPEVVNNLEARRLATWHGQEPDPDLLNVYLEEARELIDSSSEHLQEFRTNNSDLGALQALQRELHTIKGGARMVGAEGVATLAHEMETIYEELGSRRKPATRMISNLLASCHDWLASAVFVLENNYNPQTPTALIDALMAFLRDPDSLHEIPQSSLEKQIEQIELYHTALTQSTQKVERDLSVIPSMQGNFEVAQEQTASTAEMLRISAGLMERMINLSGESAINRARIEMGISSLTNTIEEMGITVQRLADQLRRMETELEVQILAQIGDTQAAMEDDFDPLEMDQYSALNQLSKSLSESASDLLDINNTMLDKTRDTENLLLQLSRTQTELQDGLMNSRTVPFSRITPRLQRIVRQTATDLGKAVELRIINDEGEIDRNILDRITSPLEHMLRNAVDHGIENSAERIEQGKPRTGRITLEVLREGGEIVIHLTDDGRGINVDAVRRKAIERGLIAADDTSLKPLDIMQYIFNAGLSTSSSVTQISGRGVGMDVVQNEVKQLGGVVVVESELGKGSRFTMRLPLTVAVSDALMVRAGDRYFAIPLVQIERIVRVNPDVVYDFHRSSASTLELDGADYRLRYLNQILYGSDPLEALHQQTTSVPVIIIRNETGQRLALQVDGLAGSRIEMVVKPLGRQVSHIAGISAATIMGDGSVMLILDLIALMRNVGASPQHSVSKPKKSASQKPVVLIIDDSVTVRKVTSRLLERNGYETQTANDGVDALEKLQTLTPDIMLLDIEMPRMDGFEVATQVRHNPRLKDVPIIMITSRTGEKHRERALAIGVTDYMGKPFQEQELLNALAHYTAQA